MKIIFLTIIEPVLRLLAHRVTNFASTLFLASFALWDIFDQIVFSGASRFGVEHGVAIHGIIMLMKSGADFVAKAGEVNHVIQDSKVEKKSKSDY
jgi:hypothetical protein